MIIINFLVNVAEAQLNDQPSPKNADVFHVSRHTHACTHAHPHAHATYTPLHTRTLVHTRTLAHKRARARARTALVAACWRVQTGEIVFTILFSIELVCNLTSFWFKLFWTSAWNWFDLVRVRACVRVRARACHVCVGL
jgi:hypothetical protein